MTTLDLTTASEGHSSASRGSVPNVPVRAHDAAVAAVEARDARSDSPLTHLDLFSGIGGFALAARESGFKTIGFAEVDNYASKVLKKHWPNVPNFGDVRTADFSRLGNVTVLTGGFPCQPYSLCGKQRGAEDDRALWPEMRRVIEVVQPDWVIAENVPGIIGMELDGVLADLEACGYATRTFIVPACAVDARHRRERVWIVGHAERDGRRAWRDDHREDEREESHAANEHSGSMADAEGDASRRGREAVSYSECQRLEREQQRRSAARTANRSGNGNHSAVWPVEPGICRVVNGLSCRVDRLRGLGNAIVPQVALPFFDAISTLEFTWREPVRAVAAAGAHGRNFGSSETQAQNDQS